MIPDEILRRASLTAYSIDKYIFEKVPIKKSVADKLLDKIDKIHSVHSITTFFNYYKKLKGKPMYNDNLNRFLMAVYKRYCTLFYEYLLAGQSVKGHSGIGLFRIEKAKSEQGSINWYLTKKTGVKVPYLNLNTDGYVLKVMWHRAPTYGQSSAWNVWKFSASDQPCSVIYNYVKENPNLNKYLTHSPKSYLPIETENLTLLN